MLRGSLILLSALTLSEGVVISQANCDALGDFNELFSVNVSRSERCQSCESLLCNYRAKGHEYVFRRLREMCRNISRTPMDEECLAQVRLSEEDAESFVSSASAKSSDKDVCRAYLKCGEPESEIYRWDLNFNRTEVKKTTSPITGAFSVLHLTDQHVSPQYAVGSVYDCDGKLCCFFGQADGNQTGAGVYGDLHDPALCDIPLRTFKSLLANAKKKKPTYIYLGGDFVPHTVINYTIERTIKEIAQQTALIAEAFPDSRIFPLLGNHDFGPLPSRALVGKNHPVNKLYKEVWGLWGGKWIPASEEETFLRGGFYTVSIQSGLRLIAVNTVYAYSLNYWQFVDPKDPEGQLVWLYKQLEDASMNNEVVHIIGHVSPGTTEVEHAWAKNYAAIVSRFRNIIRGQFFGHMHYDMFSLDTDDDGKLTGVQFSSPSATTSYSGLPSYRMMRFSKYAEIKEFETYHLNITRLNEQFIADNTNKTVDEINQAIAKLDKNDNSGEKWVLAYKTTDRYGMNGLEVDDFAKLLNRSRNDDELLKKYFRAYHQFRDEMEDIECTAGECTETFGSEKGSDRDMICEMYSYGSAKRDECQKPLTEDLSDRAGASGVNEISRPEIQIHQCQSGSDRAARNPVTSGPQARWNRH